MEWRKVWVGGCELEEYRFVDGDEVGLARCHSLTPILDNHVSRYGAEIAFDHGT